MTAVARDEAQRLRDLHMRYKPTEFIGLRIERHKSRAPERSAREAVLETVVEEMGVSCPSLRDPNACPVITMAKRVLAHMGLTQDEWTYREIAILMGVTSERARQYEQMGRMRMVRLLTKDRESIVENLRTLDGLRRGWTLPEGYES